MFNFFGKKNETIEYTLRLEDVLIDEEHIVCVFSEKGEIAPAPLKFKIEDIFSNPNLLRNIHPETIISLKKIHDMRKFKSLKLLSVINQNEFEVCFDGRFKTKISGKDFCSDLSLAPMMDTKDVITIIYNTAYSEAFSVFLNLTKEKSVDSEQKKEKKLEESLRPSLSIVK